MYQLQNRTTSLSLNEQEREDFNAILIEAQNISGRSFGGLKEAVLFLAHHFNNEKPLNFNENTNEKQEFFIPDEFQNEITEFKGETDLNTFSKILESAKKSPEIIKEVEQKDISFNLSEGERKVLEHIQSARHTNLLPPGSDPETLNEIVRLAVFNKATLYNWGGEFKTFLS